MSKTIWKSEFPVQDRFELRMPAKAEILDVQAQRNIPCIWYTCDPDNDNENRKFLLVGTGHPMTHEKVSYIGSFQLFDGDLVFHLFERLS